MNLPGTGEDRQSEENLNNVHTDEFEPLYFQSTSAVLSGWSGKESDTVFFFQIPTTALIGKAYRHIKAERVALKGRKSRV
ncbi:hypothetical protein Baya_4861 [Bagarius yarrelli]|uniref:Uncharacterized protein n=1 Tax=Bagarius yarrelli TaxID=175774 RepID=A0A556TRT9_BAGYA|nr:hypothetical protein Baya_4861 [Bagarius yarrelli]